MGLCSVSYKLWTLPGENPMSSCRPVAEAYSLIIKRQQEFVLLGMLSLVLSGLYCFACRSNRGWPSQESLANLVSCVLSSHKSLFLRSARTHTYPQMHILNCSESAYLYADSIPTRFHPLRQRPVFLILHLYFLRK